MAIRDAEYACHLCKNKYGRLKDRQKEFQRKKGCFDTFEAPILSYLPNYTMKGCAKIVYHQCPARFFNPAISELISFSEKFSSGIMPYSGSYFEQPSKFVEIMDLIYNLINEYKQERKKTLEKHGKRSNSRTHG